MTRSPKIERKVEHRQSVTEFKTDEQGKGLISGYLSTFNNVDFQGDVVRPGAFKKTLKEASARRASQSLDFLFPLLWNHDFSTPPLGGVISAFEDKAGCHITAQLNMSQQLAREIYESCKLGFLSKMSMGYLTLQSSWGKSADGTAIRNIEECALREASLVTFPANDRAQLTSVKSREDYNSMLLKDFTSNYETELLDDWRYGDWSGISSALQQSILDLYAPGADPLAGFERDVLPGLIDALQAYIKEGINLNFSLAPASAAGVTPAMMMSLAGAGGEAKRGYLNAETHTTIHEASQNIMKSAKAIHKALSSLSGSPARGFNDRAGQRIYSEASAPLDFFEEKEDEEDVASMVKMLTTGLQVDNALREAKSDLSSDAMTIEPFDAVDAALARLLDKQR